MPHWKDAKARERLMESMCIKASKRFFTVLIIGAEAAEIELLDTLLKAEDYQYSIVGDGQAAAAKLSDTKVDLLLLDIDGVDVDDLPSIKQNLAADAVPILALASRYDDKALALFLKQGIDDFVVKPINSLLLTTKINSLLQYRQCHLQQLENNRRLSAYRQRREQEQTIAANLFHKILRAKLLDTSVIKSTVSARSLFNGHIALVGRTPEDHLHVLLGDFSGSGMSAAIAAAPIAEIFYKMSDKGFDIVEIVEEINRKLHQLLPVDMFLAASIVALHPETKTLHVLNCGLPDQVLVNRASNRLKIIASTNLPLGISASLDPHIQSIAVSGDDYLYLLTDTVSEAENSAGVALGAEAVMACISQHEGSAFESLQSLLSRHCENEQTYQVITFLELLCDVDNVPWKGCDSKQEYPVVEALPWKAMMEFDIDALKKLNPVPMMVNALMEIQGLQEHRQVIFMIVTELFTNALDHGVLKLDSAIKQTAEGFMRFYELKEQRLQTVQEGRIRLLFKHRPTESGGCLTISVKDSGDGFDHQALAANLTSNVGFSGRGIGLLKSLCSGLTYRGKGNQVTAVFVWRA
ncbi:SpoIIE family protein phosphatase [Methylomarinum sp. Ch1-1]|uniref:SpoIIE family protein phosphatase n=1 Tax=Methylomarinum roseum TaxID=3067653 RepID=A0AAU7NUN0_9GAMM|nr:SpoIIE family protein phosphatase [Methylomarinum sp. Ch1-1]MDP4519572.1 SpoIIE family protein phosphatase [Methylomarinum sp. Ch1-1]